MIPLSRYLHTLRYLKPIQVFGRLRLFLPRPAVPADGLPAVRGGGAIWRRTPLRQPTMLGPARFRFLNEIGEVGDAAGWNDPAREKLWLYHLHYFDDLNAAGAAARKAWHEALIARWVAENPPGRGNGWEPYPLARRIVNWVTWAWAGNALPAGAAESLAHQARWLRRNLEWHLLGNHLLADAKGLIFAGLFFAGPEAEEWLARGAAILAQEIEGQILADGGHCERSPMYHAQVLEDLLDVLHALKNKGTDPLFSAGALGIDPHFLGGQDGKKLGTVPNFRLEETCAEAAGRMLRWLEAMTHPDGGIVLFNDAAFGEAAEPIRLAAYAASLGIQKPAASASGALPRHPAGDDAEASGNASKVDDLSSAPHFHTASLDPPKPGIHKGPAPHSGSAGSLAPNRPVPDKLGTVPNLLHLKETGYVRVDWGGMSAFLDVAPIGPDWLPGHAHADTLGFELSLGRQRLLVDSGCSQYGEGPERLRQRGTAAHNTVAIDGADSSEVWGGFRVARRAYPRDLRIEKTEKSGSDPHFSGLVVGCSHDGYRRLPGRPVHRREWRFFPGGLEIRDRIEGTFREAVGRLHFHPDVKVIVDDAAGGATPEGHPEKSGVCPPVSGRLRLPGGREVAWRILQGRGRLTDTTWHPEFGRTVPNRCLEIRFDGPETALHLTWGSPHLGIRS